MCSNPAAADGTPCDDGNGCTAHDVCTEGACGGTAYSCVPGTCQVASRCDGNGGCTPFAAAPGTSCTADANPCTSDICDNAGYCTHPPLSDGASCGSGLVCSSSTCVADCYIAGVFYTNGSANPAHLCEVCTPASAITTWSTQPDQTTCDDGNPNTTNDYCEAGFCAGFSTSHLYVVATSPEDGATSIAGSTISVIFSAAVDPNSLMFAPTSAGSCSGEFQVSLDDFNTCIALDSLELSPDGRVVTITASPGLLVNQTYKLFMSATFIADLNGEQMAADYTMATGFTTVAPAQQVNYCDMESPNPTASGNSGSTLTMYGRINEVLSGTQITGSGSANPAIIAQFGYAPANWDGSPVFDPEYGVGWIWTDASFNQSVGNDDEYQYTLTLPGFGMYDYTYRFSVDGGAIWTYCDDDGNGSNAGLTFDLAQLAVLTVN